LLPAVLDTDTEPLALAPLLTPARHEPVQQEPWPARIAQGFARWLPILLMAALALLTFWLVRQTAPVVPDRSERPVAHVPDYEMRGFSLQQHGQAGMAPSVIEGEQVRHFPDTDTYEIDGVRMRWIDELNHVTVVTARHATLDPARHEVVLHERARLVRPPQPGVDQGLELWSDHLVVDTQAQVLQSPNKVHVRYGPHEFQGDRMVYDHRERQLELQGHVQGRVVSGSSLQ